MCRNCQRFSRIGGWSEPDAPPSEAGAAAVSPFEPAQELPAQGDRPAVLAQHEGYGLDRDRPDAAAGEDASGASVLRE
jgi:hypothetical protein